MGIDSSTAYWNGIQLDDTATTTRIDYNTDNGVGRDYISGGGQLDNPWEGYPIYDSNGMYAIYVVWSDVAAAGVTRKIKISGTFQDKPIKTKVSGTFEDKPIKIKVGGTFQDA